MGWTVRSRWDRNSSGVDVRMVPSDPHKNNRTYNSFVTVFYDGNVARHDRSFDEAREFSYLRMRDITHSVASCQEIDPCKPARLSIIRDCANLDWSYLPYN